MFFSKANTCQQLWHQSLEGGTLSHYSTCCVGSFDAMCFPFGFLVTAEKRLKYDLFQHARLNKR